MFLFFFWIKTAAEQQGKQGLKRTSVQSLHNFVNFGYSNFFKMSIWYGRFSLPFHFEVAISGSNGRFSNLGFRDFFMSKFSVWNQHSFLPFQQQYFYAKKSLKPKKEVAISGKYRRFCNLGIREFFMSKNFSLKSTHFSAIPMTIFWRKRVAKSKVAKSYNGDSDLEKEWKRKASIQKCF